jgi:hypothetical protein
MRKKRKRGEEQSDDAGGQEGSSPSQPPKAKAPKRGRVKTTELSRRLQVKFLKDISIETT